VRLDGVTVKGWLREEPAAEELDCDEVKLQ